MNNNENILIQLIENNNDTYQDLRFKNKKLRDLIIQITEQLKILNIKYQNLEKQFTSEKQMLLDKLEKITGNYKLYAEGYQEKSILQKDMGTLINNYKQNNRVMNSFKDSFLFLLKKNMNIYTEFKKFEAMPSNSNKIFDLLNNIKNNLYNNILRFKKSIDMINFPEFYKEYLNFIEVEEKEENENNKLFSKKIYRNTIKKTNNKKINNINNSEKNKISNNLSYKDRRKKSFGANGNKYSFTKININTNQNNENDTRYKDTNFYTNYLRKNKDNLMKKFDESHKVNYLNFGKI
jgi:hypothetical protein